MYELVLYVDSASGYVQSGYGVGLLVDKYLDGRLCLLDSIFLGSQKIEKCNSLVPFDATHCSKVAIFIITALHIYIYTVDRSRRGSRDY